MSLGQQTQAEAGLRNRVQAIEAKAASLGLPPELLQRVQEHLREATRAAEAASQAKDRFLAMLSHELRTPLTPVLSAAQLLEAADDLKPEHRELAAMIHRNVALETRLIDDLLDLNRISHGKLELHAATIDLRDSIAHVIEIVSAEVKAHGLRLTVDSSARQHHVCGDSARLQQVMWNLVHNSIKFTPGGGEITVCSSNPQPGKLAVTVRDTGIGIAPDVLPGIFEAFEQGERKITQQYGGLGLGLAISTAIMEMHGGAIVAHSDGLGKGSSFTMTLPTVPAPLDLIIPVRASAAATATRSLRILLVEDHTDTLRLMTLLLENMGHTVIGATSKQSALQAAQAERFDLLISDIGLPDGSGLDLMRQLRQISGLRGIALSGHGMQEDMDKSAEAGFMAHITKPVELAELEKVIRIVCG